MLDWLKIRIRGWLINDYDSQVQSSPLASSDSSRIASAELFNVSIYPASGGTVLEIRRWDAKKDENMYNLHIIPEGDDFSKRCADIISLEIMKS